MSLRQVEEALETLANLAGQKKQIDRAAMYDAVQRGQLALAAAKGEVLPVSIDGVEVDPQSTAWGVFAQRPNA